MSKTRFLDDLPAGALRDHVAECAAEMGVDWPTAVSHERKIRYHGKTIELWYDENGSVYAWKAFVMGLGTSSGASDDEAIAGAKSKIDKGAKSCHS